MTDYLREKESILIYIICIGFPACGKTSAIETLFHDYISRLRPTERKNLPTEVSPGSMVAEGFLENDAVWHYRLCKASSDLFTEQAIAHHQECATESQFQKASNRGRHELELACQQFINRAFAQRVHSRQKVLLFLDRNVLPEHLHWSMSFIRDLDDLAARYDPNVCSNVLALVPEMDVCGAAKEGECGCPSKDIGSVCTRMLEESRPPNARYYNSAMLLNRYNSSWILPWSIECVLEVCLRLIGREFHPTLTKESKNCLAILCSFLSQFNNAHKNVLNPANSFQEIRHRICPNAIIQPLPLFDHVIARSFNALENEESVEADFESKKALLDLLFSKFFIPFQFTPALEPLEAHLKQALSVYRAKIISPIPHQNKELEVKQINFIQMINFRFSNALISSIRVLKRPK